MQVTKLLDGEITYNDIPKPTNAQMQSEYDYILAEQMTKKLLEQGLISKAEFNKIMAKNKLSFSTLMSRIAAK